MRKPNKTNYFFMNDSLSKQNKNINFRKKLIGFLYLKENKKDMNKRNHKTILFDLLQNN